MGHMEMIDFLVGIDGGGSGTRALLTRPDGSELGQGHAGPSGLSLGIAAAWIEIERAVAMACEEAGVPTSDRSRFALGAGLSGATHAPWRDAFLAANPGYATLAVDTDAYTMLLGAHAGRPGVIVAAGTGSVGEVVRPDGTRAGVGGWGFPVGDEGSGAWLGLRAMAQAHAAFDARAPRGPLARRVLAACGADREALLAWCARANQTRYASLAPLVFDSEDEDPVAAALLAEAVAALVEMATALDPGATLPLALAGSVARRLAPRLPSPWRERRVEPVAQPDTGAITLIRRFLGDGARA